MADVLFQTYQAIGNREDLIDIITNISPTETPMLTSFGKTVANATYNEWQTDVLSDAAANAVIEGADVTTTALTPTVRTGNYTQISRKDWRISSTQQSVLSGGRSNEYEYQAAKAMKELARDMEYELVNGTGNSGTSGAARQLLGVLGFIATNIGTGTGTGDETLTEAMYNNLLQDIYDQGGNPDTTYANGWQKRKISGFTASSTKNVEATSRTLIANIDVYYSDFGMQKIILDRYMDSQTITCLENDKWKVAMLRPVMTQELPNAGGGRKGMVEAEYTLQSLNEKASGKITGLSTS